MADWKQITARIRRARTGKDPAGQLTNLFSKTRDAMVAFELARYFETSGNTADAGRWYLTAAERFRRADWKTKAQESATRLGATEPAEIPAPHPRAKSTEATSAETVTETPRQKRGGCGTTSSAPAESEPRRNDPHTLLGGTESPTSRTSWRTRLTSFSARVSACRSRNVVPAVSSPVRAPSSEERPVRSTEPVTAEICNRRHLQPPAFVVATAIPDLASRLTQLEMNFRRLLASTPTPLDAADKAPLGPAFGC